MYLLRSGCAIGLLIVAFAVVTPAQEKKTFPSTDEINLLLTQIDRAVQNYKPWIDQEERQLGKSGAESAAKDREVVNALDVAVKALKSKPEAFNGPMGFALFEWLDDADRNAVVCSSGAFSQAAVSLMDGNTDKASLFVHLAQGCTDASTLLYTVSESAGALYARYVDTQTETASQAGEALQKCVELLKKNATKK